MRGGKAGTGIPTGFLVVRISAAGSDRADARTLADQAKQQGLSGILTELERLGNPKTQRLITVTAPQKILEMEREAAASEFPPLRSLTQYWRIDLRERDRGQLAEAATLLRQAREIEHVEIELEAMPPTVTPGDDPYNVNQGYEDAAPTGIDARWMWTQTDGEGAGIAVVDIEGGWIVTHEDLAPKSPTLIHGTQSTSSDWFNHGTAVLGELLATDNTRGVVGIAPAINSIRMSSVFDAAQTQHTDDAFIAAIQAMNAGDILLVELQDAYLPEETIDSRLDLIRLATSRGVLVVQAAGNGLSDLDAWTDGGGHHRMNRGSPDFVDSGALMVGACISAVPHERWHYSNFGSRIDCFAWGENVTTCGYGDLDNGGGDPNKQYTAIFQGTSSASPMIVGAAALIQSKYKAIAGTPLSPTQLRQILSNPATGTAQGTTVAGAIGVMPNLAAIVPNLGIVPDIYLRDAVGDSGTVPWGGAISSSPDVIVQPGPVVNPQGAYGEGSGTENSDTLGSQVESGQDNYIYVRVRNRGGGVALNVNARVYWSPPATLVTPNLWTLAGSTVIPTVPVGDLLTVAPAIQWPQAQIPPTGHYCFVAILDHPSDPAPPTPASMSWSDYENLIRGQNNVTWRNFNVVNDIPPSGTPSAFPFLVTGAPDRQLPFDLIFERRLPRDAQVAIEGPLELIRKLRQGRSEVEILKNKSGRLILPSLPRIRLSGIILERAAKHPCRLIVKSGKEPIGWGNGVAVSQHFREREVGRISWRFAPRERIELEKPKRR
jgi:hypothetical protein